MLAALVLAGSFHWASHDWCPSYQAQYGCTSTQHPRQYDVSYVKSQVNRIVIPGKLDEIVLSMDYPARISGAFNSEYQTEIKPQSWAKAKVYLPCQNGKVDNWPAFWMLGHGGWPKEGEIDIAEGLNGIVRWHYWYLSDKTGKLAGVGGTDSTTHYPPNWSGCGMHLYGLYRGVNQLVIRYDKIIVGRVTSTEIGQAIVQGPMYFIFNNGHTSAAWDSHAPTVNFAQVRVLSFEVGSSG